MEATATALQALVTSMREHSRSAAVLSDIDGTLAPIVANPAEAAVPEATREALLALTDRFALVGCLSGRRALDARRIVGLDELVYAGNHGFELLGPGDSEPRLDPALRGREDAARAFVESLDRDELATAGLRFEDKGVIQAIHWRGASDEARAEDESRRISRAAQERDLVPRRGRKVLELRPIAGIDKGSAAFRLIRGEATGEPRRLSAALFGGDDETDLDAFRALRWLRDSGRLELSACIGIASSEQPAGLAEATDAVVDDPAAYAELLLELGR